ncbi:MAG: sigma-70 family RNA polymerase sigma factor [bacterium]|nr:sigma-70 family RNA polymerase sigma factor [bacterium]
MIRSDPETLLIDSLDALLRMAARLTKSPEEAEDLVQETCARILGKRRSFISHPNPKGYAFKTLFNLARDRGRSQARMPKIVSVADMDSEIGAVQPDTEASSRFILNSLDDEVEKALEDLSMEFRGALWLREVEGFTYDEIAQIQGVPVGTVRSRLARARRLMAERLAEYGSARGYGKDRPSSRERKTS